MHIPDGIEMPSPILASGVAIATGAVAFGTAKLRIEKIPTTGALASVFFVASLIHIPIGVSSAHLLLNGLMGVLLGWAAVPAMAIALFLQWSLFGFGGIGSLGVNLVNMGLPAVFCYYIFSGIVSRRATQGKLFAAGFICGACGVFLSAIMGGTTLFMCGREFIPAIVALLTAHIPVIIAEGFITAAAVSFLGKVSPELIYHEYNATPQELSSAQINQ